MRRFLTLLLPLLVTSALPELLAGSAQESRVRTPGLHAGVEVVTDRWGIPHLRAASLDDLYFAWGWVHARDRLWQMVHARAAGDGQTHRWLGNTALRADGGAQLFRLRERSHAIWEREQKQPHVRTALERYAAGVNAYLASCRKGDRPWPAEIARLRERPRDWQPEDCILVLLGFGITLDLDLPELAEIARPETAKSGSRRPIRGRLDLWHSRRAAMRLAR
jgi:acyl-homoserine lactone acylase PvdQ